MPHRPISEYAATTAPGHSQFFRVHPAACDQLIHSGHQIFEIVTGIAVLNDVAKILPVCRTASRIWIQHYIALRSHPLEFMVEHVAVGRVGSTMNVENHRILFSGLEIRRTLNPCL